MPLAEEKTAHCIVSALLIYTLQVEVPNDLDLVPNSQSANYLSVSKGLFPSCNVDDISMIILCKLRKNEIEIAYHP